MDETCPGEKSWVVFMFCRNLVCRTSSAASFLSQSALAGSAAADLFAQIILKRFGGSSSVFFFFIILLFGDGNFWISFNGVAKLSTFFFVTFAFYLNIYFVIMNYFHGKHLYHSLIRDLCHCEMKKLNRDS